jgi:toxin FitB
LILADSNLLSETSKLKQDPTVSEWIKSNFPLLYLPTPALAELRYGCAKLVQSTKRRELEQWLDDLLIGLGDRVLPFDRSAAEAHGYLRAKMKAIGKPRSPTDSYIAAIALSRDCPVATRNTDDFEWTGVRLVNPWEK